jgi:hypothetical protein
MIYFISFVILFIFVIAINEAHLKADRLSTEIKFLQADVRSQEQINNLLRQSLNMLFKINADNIINGSILEHVNSHD